VVKLNAEIVVKVSVVKLNLIRISLRSHAQAPPGVSGRSSSEPASFCETGNFYF